MFSLIIPFKNEVEALPATVAALQPALERDFGAGAFELILVDDCSDDGTIEALRTAGLLDAPGVRVVTVEGPCGYGSALRRGFAAAYGAVLGYTDADLPVAPETWRFLTTILAQERADMISAYRREHSEGGLRRVVQSEIYNRLVRVTMGVSVRDVNFSCKIFTRAIYDRIELRARWSFIDAELMAELSRLEANVLEVPVHFMPRQQGRSTLGGAQATRRILYEMGLYLARRRT